MSVIESVQKFEFSFDYKRALRCSWGEVRSRSGIYLVAKTENNLVSIAEISPLEEFSRETLTEARDNLDNLIPLLAGLPIAENWQKAEATLESIQTQLELLPSVSWAIDSLIADLGAQESNCTIAEFIDPNANSNVLVNGLLSGAGQEIEAQYEDKRGIGFSTYKVKLLATDKFSYDPQLNSIKKICQKDSKTTFRFDCNRSLTLENAKRLMDSLYGVNIEYIEEPLSEPTEENLAALKAHSLIPIALDETIEGSRTRTRLLKKEFCDLAIIKPMLFGGYRASLQLYSDLRAAELDCVITSTLETPVGVLAGVHLAAVIGAKQKENQKACGFDTLGLFAKTFLNNRLAVHDGIIQLPKCSGLGLTAGDIAELIGTNNF